MIGAALGDVGGTSDGEVRGDGDAHGSVAGCGNGTTHISVTGALVVGGVLGGQN